MTRKDRSVETADTSPQTRTNTLSAVPASFAGMTLPEQLQLIRQAHGQHKCNLIFNSKKPEIIVPRLHPQELYMTINEIGAEDALDLVTLATPEQITLVLDLDCWEGDTLSPTASLNWLEFLLHCGEEKICRLARELEPEILALMFKKHLTIVRGIEAYDDDDAENAGRLESLYDIVYQSENAAKIIGALIKVWQEREQDSFLQIMETLRGEQTSVLEEEVFQHRAGRLLDLGIIPANEAKAIYAHVDPQSFTTGEKSDFRLETEELQSPVALLRRATPHNLLAAVLEGGISHEAAGEMLHLVNRKFSADNIDLSSAGAIKDSLQTTYDTLNLALEYLAQDDTAAAARIFNSTYLQRLFQLGHSLLGTLQKRAGKIRKTDIFKYFDEPELLFLDALQQQPPQYYYAGDDHTPPAVGAIRTLRQLTRAEQRVIEIEALVTLFTEPFGALLQEKPETDNAYGLAGILMTAVANQILKQRFTAQPIQQKDLLSLQKKTISNDTIEESFSRQVERLVQQHDPNCSFFSHYCLTRWLDFFRSVTPDTPPRQAFLIIDPE